MEKDLNYFKLSLAGFLQNSHPLLLNDNEFIAARADTAAEVYEQASLNGDTPEQAAELANAALFDGLRFSKYDTVRNILWNEFSNEVPEDDAPELAIRLLPECESVFAKYPLSDDFAYEPEYELLYTELTGTIALYLESNGIQ